MINKSIYNVHSTYYYVWLWILHQLKTGLPNIIVLQQRADIKSGTSLMTLSWLSWLHNLSDHLRSWQLISHSFSKSQTPYNIIFVGISRVHYKLDSKLNLMPSGHIWVNLVKVWILPTRSTLYIVQPCLWDFHCYSFKDMGLQIPLIPTGSPPTRKLGTSRYSLIFPALGSECQDFCLLGFNGRLHSTVIF